MLGRAFSRSVALAMAALAGAAMAQSADQVVTSDGPSSTGVTIYHGADVGNGGQLNLAWLQGYALITETRDVTIPAGRSTIRFEGVAAGMLPESVIVSGLPAGVREKNLDADLLSPRSLYARAFGRPVILRRTLARSGRQTEERAVIRSAADGSVIVQTARGFEAANCGGLNDTLVYPALPEGLSARPTLSIETDAPAASHARLTLAYLAWGFDWQTNYIVQMRPDGHHADMTAWVTLASSDSTSFAQATAAVVGGKPNFDEDRGDPPEDDGELVYHCYLHPPASVFAPPPPAVSEAAPVAMAMDIVVTAQRRMQAPMTVTSEALGDLKLYRVPVATTVAAHAQKQVAFFTRRLVTLAPIYRADISGEGTNPAAIVLRGHNRKADGLGLALPAGQVAVLEPHQGRMISVGQAALGDKAEGELVELGIGVSPQVQVARLAGAHGRQWQDYTVTVTNANRWPIAFEGTLAPADEGRVSTSSAVLTRKDGRPLWSTKVPANGRAVLRYRWQDVDQPDN